MSGMGQRSADTVREAAGKPLRRAHGSAWFTFIFMAATTMTFQTYHAVRTGQMPWPLAALYGVAAFILAITVLEFARHSPSRWVRAGAYMLTGGAMFLSASATGAVVLHAAPPRASLLFGLLMDGAAILAIHFILNGPKAVDAVAEVEQRIAGIAAQRDAERSARTEAEAARERDVTGLRAELETVTARLEGERDTARGEAETAAARAEALTRKLVAATGSGTRKRAPGNAARKPAGNGARKPPPATAPAPPETPALGEADLPGNWDELDTETKVLFLVNEKGFSGSAAGVGAGVTDARGRQIVRIAKGLTGTAPQDVVDKETRND
jgi:hypothetical protein